MYLLYDYYRAPNNYARLSFSNFFIAANVREKRKWTTSKNHPKEYLHVCLQAFVPTSTQLIIKVFVGDCKQRVPYVSSRHT